jgi:bifunctional DNA-binding transcriptional regulator/antitoxin component of YhaV-PrlF toxin-antitoxin module
LTNFNKKPYIKNMTVQLEWEAPMSRKASMSSKASKTNNDLTASASAPGRTPDAGFGEQPQAELSGSPVAAQATAAGAGTVGKDVGQEERRMLKLGPDGRVLIPADVRKAMRLRDGDTLVAMLGADGELRLWGTDVGLEKMRALAAPYMPEGSAVDAFLKERRGMWGED